MANPSQNSLDFYRDIPAFRTRRDISKTENFRPVPADWSVVIIDIRGSTKAIEEGRYRDVNAVGASAIIAAKNCLKDFDFPYVFGGDGATLIVPSSRLPEFIPVMQSVKDMAKNQFDFELRIGVVPAERIMAENKKMLVGKFSHSENVSLAVLAGSGFSLAESWIKDPSKNFEISKVDTTDASYEGLECRWNPLTSERGEFISVLIKARSEDLAEASRVYAEIVEEIELLFVSLPPERTTDPVSPVHKNLSVSLNPQKLAREWKVRTTGKGTGEKIKYAFGLMLAAIYGVLVFRLGVKSKTFDWMNYKKEVAENSDFWKYDDMLRFVLDVTPMQKRALGNLLELREKRGEVHYGIHASKTAIMTCMVLSRQAGGHVHFIDGGDGGYARAAKVLKEAIKKAS